MHLAHLALTPLPNQPIRPRLPARCAAVLCAASLLLGAQPLPVRAQNTLPALGDASTEEFGVGAERRLGDQIMRDIRRDPDYLDDPVLLEYLQSLWQPLVVSSRAMGNIGVDTDQRFAWEPFLVRDRSVNAFALPGGYFGIHLGLIAMTATRDELASVLAHEMSHITQRHIARSFANSKKQTMIGVASLILGVLAASRAGSVDGANAAIAGSQAAAIQGQLNFSRDMEREADRVGFALMSTAGFVPGGMAAMFEKLSQSSRLNDSGGFPYLRTHPLTNERIGEARARLGAAPAAALAGSLEHGVVQARSRVLMDSRIDALRRWQALDADSVGGGTQERLAAAYGSALASTLLRDWSRADAALAKAQALLPGRDGAGDARAARQLALLAAQSQLARGAAAAAAAALRPLAGDESRPVTLLTAQIGLAAAAESAKGDPALQRHADDLQTWVAVHPQDSAAWLLLGQTWARLGQPLRALRAEAEARLALGDLPGAVDRLRAGQRRARDGGPVDFIEVSVIDARLRDIEAQRRTLAADEKNNQPP